jgi:xanthine dehydrogenase small subunit
MRNYITFNLNGVGHELATVSPTLSLLNWLRRNQRLTGTKQGCGEGDCGACTVALGTLRGGVVQYRAVNACILFMAQLDGCVVHTVEHLSGDDGALHPVQQAIVEAHGSQCGFCTPGIVMSLYAAYLTEAKPSRTRLSELLAGNLCRCTGYGSILEAGVAMYDLPVPVSDRERRSKDADVLKALRHDDTIELSDGHSRAFLPATVDALADIYSAHPDATIVSGATDVGLWVTKQHRDLPVVITTNRVRDDLFCSYAANPGRDRKVYLGAGLTHTEAATALSMPALAELWRRFAGVQVRNTGTIGGNIANGSPIGDLAPAFIALGATVTLRHGASTRTVPLEDFFLSYGRQDRRPGEFLLGLTLNLPVDERDFAVHKVSKRFDDDISAVCGAFNIAVKKGVVQSARIAFGGMAATPKRATAVETALVGNPWTQATIQTTRAAFAADFSPISDMRASAGYRLTVAYNLLVRTFIERTEPETRSRLVGASAAFA